MQELRGPGRMRGGCRGGPGGPGVSGKGPGRFRGGPGAEVLELYGLPTTQQHPGFCAGGSSRPNGSGYPLSVPAPRVGGYHSLVSYNML